VGLVQREIEAAGFTTITLSPVPDLTASVSAPRVAAIEYPLGRSLGQPDDAAGQMAVLRATLAALETIRTPGGVVHLPFEWPEPPKLVRNHPPEDPPIARCLARNPWFLPKLLSRNVPG
jgi:D-proline reductase (dithiol) PrdB